MSEGDKARHRGSMTPKGDPFHLEKAPGERSPLIIEFARGSSVELALLTRAELDALTRQIAEKDAKLAELQGEIDNHNCTTHALNLAAKVQDLDMELGRERRASAEKDARLEIVHQALGLLTTLHGSMVIDVNDPMGMAQQIHAHVSAQDDQWQVSIDICRARLAGQDAALARLEQERYSSKLELVRYSSRLDDYVDALAASEQRIARLTEERDMLRAKLDARA